jgi:hypothetical protein
VRLRQPAGTPGGYIVSVANRQSPTEPNPRRTRGIPLRLLDSSLMPPRRRGSEEPGRGGGAVVVLAAIVSTPADRRAPRKSGDV